MIEIFSLLRMLKINNFDSVSKFEVDSSKSKISTLFNKALIKESFAFDLKKGFCLIQFHQDSLFYF